MSNTLSNEERKAATRFPAMGGVHSMVDCASEEDCKGKQLQPKGLGVLEQLFDADACGLYKRCAEASFGERKKAILQTRLDGLLQDLFSAHDLNKNGLLEELELIQLNKKIVLLHQGRNADMDAVKEKYQDLFRRKLDAAGKAVPFSVFKAYMLQVLADVDPDPCAQEMMLEQWIVEAQAARVMFHMPSVTSVTDLPFLSTISFDKDDLPASRTSIETTSTTASMQPPKNVRCESFVHVGPIDDNIRPCC